MQPQIELNNYQQPPQIKQRNENEEIFKMLLNLSESVKLMATKFEDY